MLIEVADNARDVLKSLDDLRLKQLPYATQLAINRTGDKVVAAEIGEIKNVFNNPTAYTLGSVGRTWASKQNLSARIFLKDKTGNNTPASKFLASEIEGGSRRSKRFEVALQSVGALPAGYKVVPGSACKVDSYGNIDRGQVAQILAYFKAFPEMGYKSNLTDKRRAALARGNKRTGSQGFVYFVGSPGNGSPLGIWQRFSLGHGSAIKPVMIFVAHANYKKLFDFHPVGHAVIDREFIGEMTRATEEALRTAK